MNQPHFSADPSSPPVRSVGTSGRAVLKLVQRGDGRRELDSESQNLVIKLITELRAKTQSLKSDSALSPGIYEDPQSPGVLRLWIPENMKPEKDSFGLFWASIAELTGLPALYYSRPGYDFNISDEVDKIFTGLLLSLDDSRVRLGKKASTGIEYGRQMGFAIRIRGHFRHNTKLGINALRKDNVWFGNLPTKDSKLGKDSYALKNLFLGLDRTKEMTCLHLFRLAIHLIEMLDLDKSDPHYERIIQENLLTFSDVEVLGRRSISTTEIRGKKKIEKIKLKGPKKPSLSPLILKEEWSYISELISPFWKNLELVSKNWYELVLNESFDKIKNLTLEVLSVRWEVITNFNKETTNRLNYVRSLDIDGEDVKNLKKADVKDHHLEAYFKKKISPDLDLFNLIQNTLPNSVPSGNEYLKNMPLKENNKFSLGRCKKIFLDLKSLGKMTFNLEELDQSVLKPQDEKIQTVMEFHSVRSINTAPPRGSSPKGSYRKAGFPALK